jgi:radical SAM superfamily enzyme YgiQ (UPF0313 family)
MEGLIKYKDQNFLGDELSWSGEVDYNIGKDFELIELMSRAGALRLVIGFESLDERFPKNIVDFKEKKPLFLDTISKIRSVGIDVIGSFIIGSDNEPESVFDDLNNFINEANLFAVQIFILTPFPGTKAYEDFKEQSRLIVDKDGIVDWDKYNCFNFVFQGKDLNRKYLNYKNFLKKIYNMDEMITRMGRRSQMFFEKSNRKTLMSDFLFALNCQDLCSKLED